MFFSLLCFSCSDHSNLIRMEFVNNASFMVFIVFNGGKTIYKKRSLCVQWYKKRDNCYEFYALSCFDSHRRVDKKKKTCVSALSHPLMVGFRSLAGGRTCVFSLCMARTGVSQPRTDLQGWKKKKRGRRKWRKRGDLDWLSNTKR